MSPPPSSGERKLSQDEVESRLTDFHYALFEILPDEGRVLGYHPLVETARHLRDKLNARLPADSPKLSSGAVGAELRNLSVHGLAVRVLSISGSILGWQRTPRAKELLDERKRHQEAVERARATAEGTLPYAAAAEAAIAAVETEGEAK